VREAKILHVAFVDGDGLPQCVPMIGALEDDAVGDHILYLHGRCSQLCAAVMAGLMMLTRTSFITRHEAVVPAKYPYCGDSYNP
jgi:hypothetical protein